MQKVKHKYGHWFPSIVGASAVTLGYTIFYHMEKEFVPRWLYLHEMEHIAQINRLGIPLFYTRYLIEYLIGRFKGLGHWDAYHKISFEIQAKAAEKNNMLL